MSQKPTLAGLFGLPEPPDPPAGGLALLPLPKRPRSKRVLPRAEAVLRAAMADYAYISAVAHTALEAAWEANSQLDVRSNLKIMLDAQKQLLDAYKAAGVLALPDEGALNAGAEAMEARRRSAEALVAALEKLNESPPYLDGNGVMKK